MYSFVSIQYDEKWIIAAVRWNDKDAYTDYDDFNEDLKMEVNALKTELIRNWKGDLDDCYVNFNTKEDADSAIGYFEGLLTASTIVKQADQATMNSVSKKRGRQYV